MHTLYNTFVRCTRNVDIPSVSRTIHLRYFSISRSLDTCLDLFVRTKSLQKSFHANALRINIAMFPPTVMISLQCFILLFNSLVSKYLTRIDLFAPIKSLENISSREYRRNVFDENAKHEDINFFTFKERTNLMEKGCPVHAG